jgi:hypothetical protein
VREGAVTVRPRIIATSVYVAFIVACGYDATFKDCTIKCSATICSTGGLYPLEDKWYFQR